MFLVVSHVSLQLQSGIHNSWDGPWPIFSFFSEFLSFCIEIFEIRALRSFRIAGFYLLFTQPLPYLITFSWYIFHLNIGIWYYKQTETSTSMCGRTLTAAWGIRSYGCCLSFMSGHGRSYYSYMRVFTLNYTAIAYLDIETNLLIILIREYVERNWSKYCFTFCIVKCLTFPFVCCCHY